MTKRIISSGRPPKPVTGSGSGTTAAAYASALNISNFKNYSKAVILLVETGAAESLKYRLRGSIAGTYWEVIVAEAVLAASGQKAITVTDAWGQLNLQVKDDSGHADYACKYMMKA